MEPRVRRTDRRLSLPFQTWNTQKLAVLRSLGSPDSRRGYQHAIDEFVAGYCSEPRLAFNKTVVLRYRFYLEERGLAPRTINVRLAAVRRLAYEGADSGLLSPELAAGIHRVKGVRKLGSRLGNWLTAGEGHGALATTRPPNSDWKTESSDSRDAARLRAPPPRACGACLGELAASRRTLGHCRLGRQREAHTNRPCAELGKGDASISG
jgi:hypothetical protein